MKRTSVIIFLLLSLSLFLGSLGFEKVAVEIFGLTSALIGIGLIYLKKGKLTKPPYFVLYLVFLIILGIYIVIGPSTYYTLSFFTLYLSGGVFYLLARNMPQGIKDKLPLIIVSLGLLMGVFYFVNRFLLANQIVPWSLYGTSSGYKNHNHIGDLWAMVLLVASYWAVKTKKTSLFLFFIPGIFFLAMSLSRSAYLSLLVGLIALGLSGKVKIKKKFFVPLFTLALLFFVYGGLFKPTLHSRPYFFQALAGFAANPLGVGVGNFGIISENPQFHIFGMEGYAGVVHNVVLEFISGMGIFGLVFLSFFSLTLYKAWKAGGKVLEKSLLFALTANLLFDSTYFIATMVWLWFILLGVTLNSNDRKKN